MTTDKTARQKAIEALDKLRSGESIDGDELNSIYAALQPVDAWRDDINTPVIGIKEWLENLKGYISRCSKDTEWGEDDEEIMQKILQLSNIAAPPPPDTAVGK